MGYRNIKPVLTDISDLSDKCGLFKIGADLNDSYGCKSKSKNKDAVGKCYSWACPLGYPTSLKDLKKYDQHLYEEYLNGEFDPKDSGFMIQYREIV